MSRAPVPYHPDCERAIIGVMLGVPERIPDIERLLEPGDFYDTVCAAAYELMVGSWMAGDTLDEKALIRRMADAGRPIDTRWVTEAIGRAGAWRLDAETILGDRARRQLLVLGADITKRARDKAADPVEIAENAKATLDTIDGPLPKTWDSAREWEWYLDHNTEAFTEWVVPGLLRRRWRCIVVATEGGGKSTMLRQFAMLAGQGLHPFHYQPIANVKVLYVDMENDPFGAGHKQANEMRRRFPDYLPGQVIHISEQRGINLLGRTDRRRLEAAVAEHRPDLLLIGPMYRMYRRPPQTTDEDAAGGVQEVLDDLRVRYGFAVVAEHHAPKGTMGHREMSPIGTSMWLRWPELGIGLERVKDVEGRYAVKHWRQPREEHAWPVFLNWGQHFPWEGEWADDRWKDEKF